MQPRLSDGRNAARLQISIRPTLLDRLDAWAAEQGLARSAAISQFITEAMDRAQTDSTQADNAA